MAMRIKREGGPKKNNGSGGVNYSHRIIFAEETKIMWNTDKNTKINTHPFKNIVVFSRGNFSPPY